MKHLPLIAPKSFREYSPEEFQTYVKSMYEERRASGRKPAKKSSAEGISLSRTKKGALSVRISSKKRAIRYVTRKEIAALAVEHSASTVEVWNLFVKKEFAIVESPEEAARIQKSVDEIPWPG